MSEDTPAVSEADPNEEAFRRVREQASAWLADQGYTVEDMPVPNRAWCIMARPAGGLIVELGQLRNGPGDLMVTCSAVLQPEQIALVTSLAPEAFERFYYHVRSQLLLIAPPVQFTLEPPWRLISVLRHLCVEDMRRQDFVDAVLKVGQGVLAVLWAIESLPGQQPVPKTPAPKTPPGGVLH